MLEKKYQNYLKDLVEILKERALKDKKRSKEKNGEYEKGRLMAYYEFISLLKQQADAFGIDLKDINLQDFDEFKELLT